MRITYGKRAPSYPLSDACREVTMLGITNKQTSIELIYVHLFCSKTVWFWKFVIDYFTVYRVVFEIGKLTADYEDWRCCKLCHRIAHNYFTIVVMRYSVTEITARPNF